MIKFIAYTFLFFLAAILQTVVVPHIEIQDARPSFLLILTIIVALRQGTLAGCSIGFVSGLLCDVYAPVEWLGAYSLAYCITGFVVGQIEESFINLNLFPKIIVLALADFLKDTIYFIAIGKTSEEILQALVSISLYNAIYTVSFGAICFYLLSPKMERKVEMYRSGK
ncbi:MAG: rod shape-determining protein MreD [Fibromonadaceae bacterium]|jgi:rod shape-determining protein MreD|nr:rod shape-determining protein MreD [Fibromonadaceae bacterium]